MHTQANNVGLGLGIPKPNPVAIENSSVCCVSHAGALYGCSEISKAQIASLIINYRSTVTVQMPDCAHKSQECRVRVRTF